MIIRQMRMKNCNIYSKYVQGCDVHVDLRVILLMRGSAFICSVLLPKNQADTRRVPTIHINCDDCCASIVVLANLRQSQ
jgi:hypothetical protein